MSRRLFLALTAVLAVVTLAPVALAHEGSGKTTVEGTLRVWHGDTFDSPVSVGEGIDTTIAGLIPLEQAPASTASLAGKRVRASGVRRGKALAVSGSVQPSGPTNAVAAATGTKSVAVLLFNFTGDTREPWTTTGVRNVVFDGAGSVNAYYQDASYGQMSVSGDVFGWYTIDATNAGCDYTTWANQARSKATAAGVPLANYAYTVYAFPNVSGCGWAGLAYLPGSGSWINGSMNLRVVGHELGHNFGVHHASTLACPSAGTSVVLSRPAAQTVRRPVHRSWARPRPAAATELASSPAGMAAGATITAAGSTRSPRRGSRRPLRACSGLRGVMGRI